MPLPVNRSQDDEYQDAVRTTRSGFAMPPAEHESASVSSVAMPSGNHGQHLGPRLCTVQSGQSLGPPTAGIAKCSVALRLTAFQRRL